MKKKIALVLCLALAVTALAGCAQTKAGGAGSAAETQESSKAEAAAESTESKAEAPESKAEAAESKADAANTESKADAAESKEDAAESKEEASTDAAAESEDAAAAEDAAEGDAAEGSGAAAPPAGTMTLGGWQKPDSPVVPDDVREALAKAAEAKLGAEYTPVAYIGRQVVNGTNHAVLCRTKAVGPDGKDTYTVVDLYVDLQGNAEIKEVIDSNIDTNILPGLVGGWQAAEDPTISDELRDKLGSVFGKRLGSDFAPIALLGTQVVSGTNYCVFGESTPVVPNGKAHYVIAYIYEDLQGNLKITDIVDFN